MDVVRHPARLAQRSAACLGAFDGMHRGHQALVRRAAESAEFVAVAAFEPHPAHVLRPDRPFDRLQSADERARVCRALGVHTLSILPFDARVAASTPEDFVRTFLVDALRPDVLVVGEDFRFGHDRKGDPALLRELLAELGSPTLLEVVAELCEDATKVGSTRIRGHLRVGELALAADLLGRWYARSGPVRHGAARGRTLGRPTANIETHGDLMLPTGVYAVIASEVLGQSLGPAFPAVANLGRAPTFEDGRGDVRLEVHILDREFGDTLYDREFEIAFVERLRDERRFSDTEALTTAIEQDIERARPILGAEALQRRLPERIVGASR